MKFQNRDKQCIRLTECDAIESFNLHSNHVRHSIGIDYVQLALESCKTPDTCHNVRVIEIRYSMGQKYFFELRRCSS